MLLRIKHEQIKSLPFNTQQPRQGTCSTEASAHTDSELDCMTAQELCCQAQSTRARALHACRAWLET